MPTEARSTAWLRRLAAAVLFVWLGAMGLFGPAQAGTIEAVLAPGELIADHAKLESECASCHVRFNPKGQDALCMDCHKDVGQDVRKRMGFHGKARDPEASCRGCHTDHKGRKARIVQFDPKSFDHKQTDYLLKGKHKDAACDKCHAPAKKYRQAASDCLSCHKKDDAHKGGILDKAGAVAKCSDCHSESGWRDPPRFDHDKTSFPLLGKHLKAECKACHKSQLFKEAPKDCFSCHQKDDKHQGTLGKACADCHSERDWKTTSGRFDHSATRFPLRNAHAASKVKCSDCHTQGLSGFRQTAMTCYACHQKDDKHEGSQGRQCESCHNDASWKVTLFDHGKTRFPLTGRHNGVICQDCHASKRFKDTPRDCIACHLKDDKHKASLGTQCETCHNTRHWKSWDFNHDKRTKYPLTGAHTKVRCAVCHTQAAPKGKPIAELSQRCVDCHAKDDAHDGQFGRRCEQCHRTSGWLQTEKTLSLSSSKVFTLNVQLAHIAGWSSHSQRLAPLPAHAAASTLPDMDDRRLPAPAGVGAERPVRGGAGAGGSRAHRTGANLERKV